MNTDFNARYWLFAVTTHYPRGGFFGGYESESAAKKAFRDSDQEWAEIFDTETYKTMRLKKGDDLDT